MSDGGRLTRRDALKLLGLVPLAPLAWTPAEVTRAASAMALPASAPRASAAAYVPRFFTPHEYATVILLADMVIPADTRSGSATDARVPEFMDFMMTDGPEERRRAMRGGLAWLDGESRRRSGLAFLAATPAKRAAILDDIAWPERAPATLSYGVAFFSRFRDLTAAGFFSSEMGHRDLGYIGNVPVMEWRGCGAAANAHALRANVPDRPSSAP